MHPYYKSFKNDIGGIDITHHVFNVFINPFTSKQKKHKDGIKWCWLKIDLQTKQRQNRTSWTTRASVLSKISFKIVLIYKVSIVYYWFIISYYL